MIYVFLANGFEECEALAPIDILKRAGFEVVTVGIGSNNITGSHGVTIITDTINKDLLSNVIIAYEPIWSIGTGIIPSNQDIYDTISFIKHYLQ